MTYEELIERKVKKEAFTFVEVVLSLAMLGIVAALTVALNLILSSLAAYPLARMQFKGKKFFFLSILATIMIPFQAIMLPVYIITLKLHLIDSVNNVMGYIGLVMPFAESAFGIFLMRQAFLKVPKEF